MLKRFWSPAERILADPVLERVKIDGQAVSLPRKPMRVLLQILKAAPEPASRHALIDDIWNGNDLTGEKGLTQALWSIRLALERAGGIADWIRTETGVGYQWVGPTATIGSTGSDPSPRRARRIARPVFAACSAVLISGLLLAGVMSSDAGQVQKIVAPNGSIALMNPSAVMVADHQGRHVNFLVTPPTIMNAVAFSDDGEKIFISASKGTNCQVRIFAFESQHMESYETCAHQGSGAV